VAARNAGTPSGCSLPTGRAACRAHRYDGPGSRRLHDDGRSDRVHRALRHRPSRAPVRTGTNVTSVRRTDDGYHVTTSRDEVSAGRARGASAGEPPQPRADHPLPDGGPSRAAALQPANGAAVSSDAVPAVRRAADALLTTVTPAQLPDGGVLVVGSGPATGVQLAGRGEAIRPAGDPSR